MDNLSDTDFERFVNEAIKNLPDEFSERLENVSLVVQDWPTRSQDMKFAKRGERIMLLGLYEGVPQTKRSYYGIGGPLPDKISLFKVPLLKISNNIDHLKENIKDTLIHEIGHHFGLSDDDISRIKGKKSTIIG